MDFQSIILIIVSLINITLAYIVFVNNKRDAINRSFSLAIVGASIWVFTNAATRLSTTLLIAWIWSVISYMSAVLIALSLFYFSLVFPVNLNTLKRYHKLLIYLSCPIILLVLAIPGVTVKNIILQPWKIVTGPGLIIFAVYFLTFMVWAFVNLIQKYRQTEGVSKAQIRYIFVGVSTSAILGISCNLLLPLLGDYRFVWLGPIFSIFMIGFSAYAITRYRLMDIRFALGRGFVYVASWASAVGAGLGLYYLNQVLGQPLPFAVVFPVAVLAAVFVYHFLFAVFERLAGKYFYYTFYSYQQVIGDLTERLTRILDLDELGQVIVETLVSTMRLDRAVVLLRDKAGAYKIVKNVGFKEENGISLVKDNFLTKHLQSTKKPVVYEELSLAAEDAATEQEKQDFETLKRNMEKIEANLCLPLFQRQALSGIIVLGKKISGDPYSREDMQLLTALANQTAIALENARLYDRVRDLSTNLQDKVDQQTRKLKQTLAELQQLNDTKTEFISMASHQLRTPLTIIRGYVSMLLDGDFGELPQKMRKPLQNVSEASLRLVKIVRDLLDVSQIELGKMALKTEPTDILKLIKECCEEMQKPAQDKGLILSFHQPSEPLPKIQIDPSKIYQVVLNLIDNAVRYTDKGRIDVSLKKQDKSIVIKVKDTGQGLSEEDKKKLFEGFVRGSAGRKEFIEGTGLGLYVAKKYIFSHHGRLWAESRGKGHGSSFCVELPLSP